MNRQNYFHKIKCVGLLLTVLLFTFAGKSQTKNDPMKTALLIVDIQNFYFPGEGTGLVRNITCTGND